MAALRNSRQERYVQNWFKGETKEQSAIIAGYQPKWAASIGSKLSINHKILARYDELQKKAEDASVANVLERKQILTEIARGKVVDFTGEGNHIEVTPESLNTAAIQELNTSQIQVGKGEAALLVEITKLKLHDPAKAIDLLNKMEKLYTDGVYVDNRTLNIVGDLTDEQLVIIAGRGHSTSRSGNGASEAEESSE